MIPHIDAKERGETSGGLERVLVCSGGNFNGARGRVEPQPTPPRPLHGSRFGGKCFFERVKRSKASVNCRSKLAFRSPSARCIGWRKVGPEYRVVNVTTAVKPWVWQVLRGAEHSSTRVLC